MRTQLPIAVATAALAVSVCAESTELRTIAVTGTGTVEVEPNYAEVWFVASMTKPEVAEAKADVDSSFDRLMEVFEQLEIDKESLNTGLLDIEPHHDWFGEEPQFKGYAVTRRISVTLHDLDKLEALFRGAVNAGVTSLGQVEFGHSDQEQMIRLALEKACDQAAARAEILARRFGAKLGEVRAITQVEGPRWITLGGDLPGRVGSGGAASVGRIKISADLNVEFELVSE